MPKIRLRAYTSATLVLLAMDLPVKQPPEDFLGFAIKRTPGFRGESSSWLTNRIGFDGPPEGGGFLPSNEAPIQKFMWWDAQIDTADRGKSFGYEVWPVMGEPGALSLDDAGKAKIKVVLPRFTEGKIGTWFNRAVVSSQAFTRLLNENHIGPSDTLTEEQELTLRRWLANGLEMAIPEFLESKGPVSGAVYHIEDRFWVRPALEKRKKPTEIVYDARPVRDSKTKKTKPSPNEEVVADLEQKNGTLKFDPRTKANIMHNKVLVETSKDGAAKRVLCGSANFTSGGLSSQANLLHVIESPELAAQYLKRVTALQDDPTLGALSPAAKWSKWVSVGDAEMRVIFSPEPNKSRLAMDAIIKAIKAAKSSVVFCLFTPTDGELRDACFKVADRGLMMFGLVNRITAPKMDQDGDGLSDKTGKPLNAAELAAVELYHRTKNKKDVVGAELFRANDTPAGFLGELKTLPGTGGGSIPPVIIHHKFIVIDAEADNPVIFTGSANMSNNAQYKNDENLLQIRGSTALAGTYLAEFMRLYEHYRARADGAKPKAAAAGGKPKKNTFRLTADSSWCQKHYKPGTPEARARQAMAD